MTITHETNRVVVFGDCDPAGIVYYPNIYRWMDGTFQTFLHDFGGHQAVCDAVGSVGLGLMETKARYRRPLRDGDRLRIVMQITEWQAKSLTLSHTGYVGDALAFEGIEVRGLFCLCDGVMRAGDMAPLRQMIEPTPA